MSNSNLSSVLAKSVLNFMNGVNNILPLYHIPCAANLHGRLDSYYKLITFGDDYVFSDYYNGSENDFVNIFLEINDLVKSRKTLSKNYFDERLSFLVNEGLHMANLMEFFTFKMSEEEAAKIVTKKLKQTKLKPKTKRKPVKKLRRNKLGQFVKGK